MCHCLYKQPEYDQPVYTPVVGRVYKHLPAGKRARGGALSASNSSAAMGMPEEMVRCDTCMLWVHAECDGLGGCTLYLDGLKAFKYECPSCRLEKPGTGRMVAAVLAHHFNGEKACPI